MKFNIKGQELIDIYEKWCIVQDKTYNHSVVTALEDVLIPEDDIEVSFDREEQVIYLTNLYDDIKTGLSVVDKVNNFEDFLYEIVNKESFIKHSVMSSKFFIFNTEGIVDEYYNYYGYHGHALTITGDSNLICELKKDSCFGAYTDNTRIKITNASGQKVISDYSISLFKDYIHDKILNMFLQLDYEILIKSFLCDHIWYVNNKAMQETFYYISGNELMNSYLFKSQFNCEKEADEIRHCGKCFIYPVGVDNYGDVNQFALNYRLSTKHKENTVCQITFEKGSAAFAALRNIYNHANLKRNHLRYKVYENVEFFMTGNDILKTFEEWKPLFGLKHEIEDDIKQRLKTSTPISMKIDTNKNASISLHKAIPGSKVFKICYPTRVDGAFNIGYFLFEEIIKKGIRVMTDEQLTTVLDEGIYTFTSSPIDVGNSCTATTADGYSINRTDAAIPITSWTATVDGKILIDTKAIDGVIRFNKDGKCEQFVNEKWTEIKENKNNMLKNLDFGKINAADGLKMSIYGVAVLNDSGKWVSYDSKTNSIIDVDVFNFDCEKFLFKMPVGFNDIKEGDMIIHNKIPMYITKKELDGALMAIDPKAGENKSIILTKNMFGFNYATKVINLFDTNGTFAASPDTPFGNMLPMLMLQDADDIDPLVLAMCMGGNQAPANKFNPLMMAMLLDKNKKDTNLLALALMSNNVFKG